MNRRVLHLIPSFGPGGAERQVGYLASGLVARGVEVHVGYIHGGPNLARLEQSGATLHRIRASSNYDPRLLPRISKLIASIRPQVIQTWLPMMDVLGGIASRFARIPWIIAERNTPSSDVSDFKIRARNALVRHVDIIVSNSRSGDRYWSGRFGAEKRAFIPNALPLDEIAACPSADRSLLGAPVDAPVILYVGRLEPQKNIETLLSALEIVVERCGAFAILCGEGSLRSLVDARVEAPPLFGRVRAAGFVGDIWSFIKSADVVVSISHFEGMPNAVMEAMACGRPVVVSDIPQHREILPDHGALFVPVDDPESIARALIECLTEAGPAAERAARARAHSRRWSIDAVAEEWDRIYARATGVEPEANAELAR